MGCEDSLEKEMATHSSILAWEIPWTEEPGRLQFMESQRVGHDLMTEHALNFFPMFYFCTFQTKRTPYRLNDKSLILISAGE